jgi:hypothetical protein
LPGDKRKKKKNTTEDRRSNLKITCISVKCHTYTIHYNVFKSLSGGDFLFKSLFLSQLP